MTNYRTYDFTFILDDVRVVGSVWTVHRYFEAIQEEVNMSTPQEEINKKMKFDILPSFNGHIALKNGDRDFILNTHTFDATDALVWLDQIGLERAMHHEPESYYPFKAMGK